MRIISTIGCLTLSLNAAIVSGENDLAYWPNPDDVDKGFAWQVLKEDAAQKVVAALSASDRGRLDEAFTQISRLAMLATREAQIVSNQDAAVRRNLFNHIRDTVVLITREWCEPRLSWFCNRHFMDSALVYVDNAFCSSYKKEMRDQTCLPEARFDYNRAKLARSWDA